mmetsp:Transcript_37635/g.116262  ORF Transcript_37635/g.116262 Transcript_37635/m.116262 type:complete len:405 (-) Transcript_37635:90-1304(-)
MQMYARNREPLGDVEPDRTVFSVAQEPDAAASSDTDLTPVSIADPPKAHPCPSRELFSAARSHEEKAERALSILEAPHLLSFAFEHALWTTVLRARGSEFPLRKLGVTMTRLDVAYIVYLLLPALRPMTEAERAGTATLLTDLTVETASGPLTFPVVINAIEICALGEILSAPLAEPASLVDLLDRLRPKLEKARLPAYDAPLPTAESMCRLAVMLAAKNIYSVRLPTMARVGSTTVVEKSVSALHLLPPEPAATIDGSLKPRDASLVLTRLAVFCNEDHRSEQAVNLCQLAIARFSKSPVAWVTLHNALRRLGAAVRLPSHCDDLFNPADCYLEAIKHDAANGLANAGMTHGEVEAARARFDLTPRYTVDLTERHWFFAKRTKLIVFAAIGVVAWGVSRRLSD